MAGGQNSENIAVEDTSGSVSTPPATPLVAPLATSLQEHCPQFKHSVKVATQFQHLQVHSNNTPQLYFYTDENIPPSQKTVTVSMYLTVFVNHLVMFFQIIRSLSIFHPVQPLTQRC